MSESELPLGDPTADEPAADESTDGEASGVADFSLADLAAAAEETEPAAEAGDSAGETEAAEPEAAEPEEGDPVQQFKTELRLLPGDWYVVHSYAGYENRVRTNLESRTQSLNMEDYIFQIEVPRTK